MLKIIEKPSPLMSRALEKLENGAKIGERLVEKELNNGKVNIIYADSAGDLVALDKIVQTTYANFKTRFIYDGKKLQRWKIKEKTPIGEITYKIADSLKNSHGELRLRDNILYTFMGTVTDPHNIRRYGRGEKISKEEFLYTINYIRNIRAKAAYTKKDL